MSGKPNKSPMEELVSKVAKIAKGGNPNALEFMEGIEGFRLQAEMILAESATAHEKQMAEQKKLKVDMELIRKRELGQWVAGIARGESVEAKVLTTADLDLITRNHVGIFETDVVEINKIRIGPGGPAIAKGWCEDFQKLVFPDGGKEGFLQVQFDNAGAIADIRIKRK